MLKKTKTIIWTILIYFVFSGIIFAEGNNKCEIIELGKLREYASSINANVISGIEETKIDNEQAEENYLYIKIYNMNSSMRLVVTNDNNSQKHELTYRNIGSDGSITLKQTAINKVINYTIDVYGGVNTNCYSEKLRTIKVTVPKYNYYSNLEMCSTIPDYYLCQEYITFDIDGSTASDKINEYREKIDKELEEKEVKTEEKNKSVIKKARTFFSDYKYILIGLLVILGVIITIIILKRKRSEF